MKINIHPDARLFLQNQEHAIVTISADRECVGANCSTAFTHAIISHKMPETPKDDQYDLFDLDGITVFFEKSLETVPEITLVKEHHLFKDQLKIEGLPVPPMITHSKL